MNRGVRELEGNMLTKTVLVVAMCSIGATVAASAQDEARIFQYSPFAQLVGEGQYRAEVWRRENASGKEERAWSNADLHRSSAEAIAAACATLRENYGFACTQTSSDARAARTVKGPGTVVASPPKEKMPPASSRVSAPKTVATV